MYYGSKMSKAEVNLWVKIANLDTISIQIFYIHMYDVLWVKN